MTPGWTAPTITSGRAVTWAAHLHADQTRKVSGAPYVAHLLGAAGIAATMAGQLADCPGCIAAYYEALADFQADFQHFRPLLAALHRHDRERLWGLSAGLRGRRSGERSRPHAEEMEDAISKFLDDMPTVESKRYEQLHRHLARLPVPESDR
jgi:hypothetical protein